MRRDKKRPFWRTFDSDNVDAGASMLGIFVLLIEGWIGARDDAQAVSMASDIRDCCGCDDAGGKD